jgi:SAM-dependent methyltransferase
MAEEGNHYEKVYSKFSKDVFAQVRRETFGDDFGQFSWTSRSEFEGILKMLELQGGKRLLDVACGAGGPALLAACTTGCEVLGVDNNASAIRTASRLAAEHGVENRAIFRRADASHALPFEDASFDSIVCIDAIVLLPKRLAILRDWKRLLRPGGRVVFTDPAVVTGLVTDEELATRSLDTRFIFSPPGEDQRLVRESGLTLLRSEDSTSALERVAAAWHASRARHKRPLVKLEGHKEFLDLQRFYECIHRLAQERRLSRFTFLAERRPKA